jgi:hypothetical protein
MIQSWFWPSMNWWSGQVLGHHDNPSIALSTFYLLYLCRYLSQTVFTAVLEYRRKDFVEMMIHHTVTSVLVSLSYYSIFIRVGLVIMVLLDVGDPPLHFAKLAKYMHEVYGSSLCPLLSFDRGLEFCLVRFENLYRDCKSVVWHFWGGILRHSPRLVWLRQLVVIG